MTEREWLACAGPDPMLEFLWRKAGDRKLRLFQVACCRRVWDSMPEDCREAVLVAERFADGEAGDGRRRAAQKRMARCPNPADLLEVNARDAALRANEKTVGRSGRSFLGVAVVAGEAASRAAGGRGKAAYKAAYRAEEEAEARLLRCIAGNPFRPVALDPAWLTSTVMELARGIYAERAFDRLPILADALQDAGCGSADVLTHCREPGPHARGCWVVDLLMGKG